jgi:hypothetical protein
MYQLLQVSQDFIQHMYVNVLWRWHNVRQTTEYVLYPGSSFVIRSGSSKLIRSTNSLTVSGPDFKGEITSYMQK